MSPKRPKSRTPTASAKRDPKTREGAGGPDHGEHRVTFSFLHVDPHHDGAWSWPTSEEAGELLAFLCEMGKLTWNEVRRHTTGGRTQGKGKPAHRKHHEMLVGDLCADAQRRLADLHLDEVFGDQMFRFRVSSEGRLWGFAVGGVFYMVWWDRAHQVYPLD